MHKNRTKKFLWKLKNSIETNRYLATVFFLAIFLSQIAPHYVSLCLCVHIKRKLHLCVVIVAASFLSFNIDNIVFGFFWNGFGKTEQITMKQFVFSFFFLGMLFKHSYSAILLQFMGTYANHILKLRWNNIKPNFFPF